MKSLRVDGVTGDVLAPVIKRNAPGIGTMVGTKTGQAMQARLEAEPAAILLPHGAVGCLNLAVVKDGFAENQIAIRAPHKIMQCVVRILAAKASEHLLTIIRLAIAIGVLNETHVRLFAHVHAAIAEFKGQWNLQVISKHCRFVRFAITISVLENHNFVVRFVARVHVRISCRAAHPHAPT